MQTSNQTIKLHTPDIKVESRIKCNAKLFETWVEKFLIKELKPGQFVVMDNASFHKSKKTKELIESVGLD